MKKMCLKSIFILLFLSCCFGSYSFFKGEYMDRSKAVNASVINIYSTKEWQDTISLYLNKRNDLINDILSQKYSNNKKWLQIIKLIECPPLLYGDISLLEYMSKNPAQFTGRIDSIKVEYNSIRQLTSNEVVMVSKISFMENDIARSYDYKVMFKYINDNWLLSELSFAE